MARRVSLALAIIAGIAAALLSSTSPQVQYDGHSKSCTALLVAFEDDQGMTQPLSRVPSSAGDREWVDYQLARACDRKEEQWAWLTGLAALVCVVAGSKARFAKRGEDEGSQPDDRAHNSV